jgi:hypothetical protein
LQKRSDACSSARSHSSAATPGGLEGEFDHGVLTRPRASRRSQDRRYAAYDREAVASRELAEQQRLVSALERQLSEAERNAGAHRDLANLAPGDFVRDRWGWHTVARVSKKSVSVETGYSWTDRIPLAKVIETRMSPQRLGELNEEASS